MCSCTRPYTPLHAPLDLYTRAPRVHACVSWHSHVNNLVCGGDNLICWSTGYVIVEVGSVLLCCCAVIISLAVVRVGIFIFHHVLTCLAWAIKQVQSHATVVSHSKQNDWIPQEDRAELSMNNSINKYAVLSLNLSFVSLVYLVPSNFHSLSLVLACTACLIPNQLRHSILISLSLSFSVFVLFHSIPAIWRSVLQEQWTVLSMEKVKVCSPILTTSTLRNVRHGRQLSSRVTLK